MVVSFHRAAWWDRSYLTDYATIAIVIVVVECIGIFQAPFCRYLSKTIDSSTDYPLLEESVPSYVLIIGSLLIPTVVFLCFQHKINSKHDLHNALLSLAEGIILTEAATVAAKLTAGRYRPDWIGRVKKQNFVEDVVDYCSVEALNAGRKSFPSGHSSMSFAAATVLSLYIAGKLKVFSERQGHVWKLLVVMLPFIPASYVAISRTRDYYHDFDDICAGAAIGIIISSCCYFLNYRSVFVRDCDIPINRVEEGHVSKTESIDIDRESTKEQGVQKRKKYNIARCVSDLGPVNFRNEDNDEKEYRDKDDDDDEDSDEDDADDEKEYRDKDDDDEDSDEDDDEVRDGDDNDEDRDEDRDEDDDDEDRDGDDDDDEDRDGDDDADEDRDDQYQTHHMMLSKIISFTCPCLLVLARLQRLST
eukprot:CFRG0810T1